MSGRPRNTAGRFAINVSSSLITMILRMTVLVWVSQYLLRRIAPEEYALIPVVTGLLIVTEIFPMIFLRGITRFMVEADAKGDQDRLRGIVSSMTPVLASVGVVLVAAGLAGVVWIDSVIAVDPAYRSDAQMMLLLLIAGLAAQVVATPFQAGLFVRMRFVEMNLIALFAELVRVGLLFALFFWVDVRALWVPLSSVAGNLVNIAILTAFTMRVLPAARFRRADVSLKTVKQLLSFSLWTIIQGMNGLVLRAAPALILNRHSTAVDVAAYHIGGLADTQIRRLVNAAMSPAAPALTTVFAEDGASAMERFYYLGGRYGLWFTLFLAPPLIVFSEPLIDLYVGETFADAAIVMALLLGAYPFTWASWMFYQIAYAVGRIKVFNLSSLLLTIGPLVSMWYLVAVEERGAVGAAIGMAASYALAHLFVLWPLGLWLVKGRWAPFLRRTLLRGVAPFLAALAACGLFQWVVPITSWGVFFAGCGVSALVYIVVLLGLCLDHEDRDLAMRGIAKIKSRIARLRN